MRLLADSGFVGKWHGTGMRTALCGRDRPTVTPRTCFLGRSKTAPVSRDRDRVRVAAPAKT